MLPFVDDLIKAGLRLVANAVLVKGKEFIKEKTGIDLDKGALSEEDTLKLRQFQAEHEEELLRLKLEDNRLELEETKAFLGDVQDARKTLTMLQMDANAPLLLKLIQPALALLVVVLTVVAFIWLVSILGANSTMNQAQKDVIIYILGVLSAALTQVLNYYFGSSQSSANKSKSLDAAILARTGSDNK